MRKSPVMLQVEVPLKHATFIRDLMLSNAEKVRQGLHEKPMFGGVIERHNELANLFESIGKQLDVAMKAHRQAPKPKQAPE